MKIGGQRQGPAAGEPDPADAPLEDGAPAIDDVDPSEGDPQPAQEPAAPPAAPSAPLGVDPGQLDAVRRAVMRVAAARTPEEREAAQRDLRQVFNLDATQAAEPDAPDVEVLRLEAEMLDTMQGETPEERRKNLAAYHKMGDLQFARNAKRVAEMAAREAKTAVQSALSSLGLTPDDVQGLLELRRNQEWEPHIQKLGAGASSYVKDARALREKLARAGEELSHEEALQLVMQRQKKTTAPAGEPAPRRQAPPVTSAEAGPSLRPGNQGRLGTLTNEEILASFRASQKGGGSGGGGLPGFRAR